MHGMRLGIVPLAVIALLLAACGGETPVRASTAGGDPGTEPAPTASAEASTTATATATKTAPPTAATLETTSFGTPSGRLACTTIDGDGGTTLVCDVRPRPGDKGLPKPSVPITKACEELAASEWGNGVSLPPTGSAFPNCSTDIKVTDQHPPVLGYGATWKRAGYVCESGETGLTCTRGDHRFFANRDVIQTR
jgi:hypothetical protein